MDEIQKILVKAGRKDLAQKYYNKLAKAPQFKENKDVQNAVKLINNLKSTVERIKTDISQRNILKKIIKDIDKLSEKIQTIK